MLGHACLTTPARSVRVRFEGSSVRLVLWGQEVEEMQGVAEVVVWV